jgi:hypothetical protein
LYKKSVFSRFNAIFISYKQTLNIPEDIQKAVNKANTPLQAVIDKIKK